MRDGSVARSGALRTAVKNRKELGSSHRNVQFYVEAPQGPVQTTLYRFVMRDKGMRQAEITSSIDRQRRVNQFGVEAAQQKSLEQQLPPMALPTVFVPPDREIDIAVIQQSKNFFGKRRTTQQLDGWRGLSKPGAQLGHQHHFKLARKTHSKSSLVSQRIECIFRRQYSLSLREDLSNGCSQRMGAGRRDHVMPDTDEEFVLDQDSQRRQVMTHRGLLKPQTRRGLRDVPIAHQRIESDEQVEVERPEIEMID